MRALTWCCVGLALSCAPGPPARISQADASRADDYARRADSAFRAGARQPGLELATRALVVRIATCGPDCPEVGRSFVQLGDLRRSNGQAEWAAQCYRRALEIFALHRASHAEWYAAARERLDALTNP